MTEDYQHRFNQLRKVCKKQEETIKRLQAEIRERCQSYLLYSSRFKKGGMGSQVSENMERESTYSTYSRLSSNIFESIVKETVAGQSQTPRKEVEEGQSQTNTKQTKEQNSQTILRQWKEEQVQTSQWPVRPKLALERTAGVHQTLSSESKNYDSSTPEGIIASFKERIAKMQQAKNSLVAELEQANKSKGKLSTEITQLKKELENSAKAQKRLSSNIKSMPECENQVSQLYRLVLNMPADREEQMVSKLKVINLKLANEGLQGLQAVSPQKSVKTELSERDNMSSHKKH